MIKIIIIILIIIITVIIIIKRMKMINEMKMTISNIDIEVIKTVFIFLFFYEKILSI